MIRPIPLPFSLLTQTEMNEPSSIPLGLCGNDVVQPFCRRLFLNAPSRPISKVEAPIPPIGMPNGSAPVVPG